jgi:hypothetical protein
MNLGGAGFAMSPFARGTANITQDATADSLTIRDREQCKDAHLTGSDDQVQPGIVAA